MTFATDDGAIARRTYGQETSMKDRIPAEPLRGEAAYRARKAEIAKRNESACADGAVRRAAKEARISAQRVADERQERRSLQRQAHP